MRSSNLELPSAAELRQMIEKESPRRAVRRDYLDIHPEIFTSYRSLVKDLGADVVVLDDFLKLSFDDVLGRLLNLTDVMVAFFVENQDTALARALYEPLNNSITPEKSDLIFVFGSPNDFGIAKAVELYHSGIASKIMVTGSAPHWGSNEEAEAQRTARFAQDNGVPKEDILIEDQSIALPDNVKCSIDIFEKINWRPERVTLVTSEFNVRRASMDMYKFPAWKMKVFATAPTPSEQLMPDEWIKSDYGRRVVLNEYAKLITETKIDQILQEGAS